MHGVQKAMGRNQRYHQSIQNASQGLPCQNENYQAIEKS